MTGVRIILDLCFKARGRVSGISVKVIASALQIVAACRAMTVRTIAVKETRYAGILFRSRLEARWAVFYDSLKIRWRYEKERYQVFKRAWSGLPGMITYLPDFYLPDFRMWVEVKGEWDKGECFHFLDAAAALLDRGDRVVLLHDVPESYYGRIQSPWEINSSRGELHARPWFSDAAVLAEPFRIAPDVSDLEWRLLVGTEARNGSHKLKQALHNARSARFE